MIRTSTMYWYQCDNASPVEDPSSECYRLSDGEESMVDATRSAREAGWQIGRRHLCPKCRGEGK